ncbi:endonuclease [Streptomyces tritici]|uniref:endonuclease n=1 Tax=Streptomyces tritici TaxID=2054410 RepID=UPI003AEF7AE2
MPGTGTRASVEELLAERGETYAEEAGIRLKDTPQPLYELLVLAHLLSARIRASTAVAAARALFAAGMNTPERMRDATWQQRVDALGEGGYRRYDERTATQLGREAELVLDEYGGDLRRMRRAADGDADALREALRGSPGIGPAGADIFLREVQGIWPEFAPVLDDRTLEGARKLDLPTDPAELAALVPKKQLPSLAAALVRTSLDHGKPQD